MKVEIKESHYITHINGLRYSKRYGSRYKQLLKKYYDNTLKNNIEKAKILIDYYEETYSYDCVPDAVIIPLTFGTVCLFGFVPYAAGYFMVHGDINGLLETTSIFTSTIGFFLTCHMAADKHDNNNLKKIEELGRIHGHLYYRDMFGNDYNKHIEESSDLFMTELLSTPGIQEMSNPKKMASDLCLVKYNAVYTYMKGTKYSNYILSMPGVQEFINDQLIRIGRIKDENDLFRNDDSYKMCLSVSDDFKEKSLLISSYLYRHTQNYHGEKSFDVQKYKITQCEDNNLDHEWVINDISGSKEPIYLDSDGNIIKEDLKITK